MILILCIVLGLALRFALGKSMHGLESMRLSGESVLLLLLIVQAVLPVVRLNGVVATVAFGLWLATFPVLASVAWLNRGEPGMLVLCAGLLMNFVVIALNGGMPVDAGAVRALTSVSVSNSILPGDFVHVIASTTTRMPWLADVLPVPGPAWIKAVASPGDCLLFAGVVSFLSSAPSAKSILRG